MDLTNIPYLGETLSLSTAVIWALAVVMFKKSGEQVHPLSLNMFKNILAAVLFLLTMPFFNLSLYDPNVALSDYGLILLSGVLGIGIGDTLFFIALNRLGAGLTAIVDCLYAPMVIFLSFIWLGESLTVIQFVGVILIVSAILAATIRLRETHLNRRDAIIGISVGVLALVCMAAGIIVMKPVLNRLPLLWVTEIRLLGGIIFLLLVLAFHPARHKVVKSAFVVEQRFNMIFGSFLGAYLAMIIWVGGMKFTQVSTASALNQTTNVFIFIFAALFLKEKITLPKTIGIILAMSGAGLVIFG